MHDFYWPFPAIIGLVVLLTGMIVYAKDPPRRLNQAYLLETIVVFSWSVANAIVVLNWHIPHLQVLWDHLSYVIGFLIAPGFALLTYYLPKARPPEKWLVVSAIAASSLIIGIPLGTPLLEGHISDPYPANQVYLASYSVLFLAFVLRGMSNIRSRYRQTQNPLVKKQLKILRTGLNISFATGILTGIIVPMAAPDTWILNLLSVPSGLIFTLFIGYAVSRYGLMAPLPFAMDQIFQNFYVGIVVMDLDGTIVKSNPSVTEVLDLKGPVNGLDSKKFAETLAERIGNAEERELFRTWFSSESDGEQELLLGEKPQKVIIAMKSVVEGPHGFPLGKVYTFFDNTDQKKREIEWKQNSEFHKGLLANANDIIFICDKTGKIMSANKMAAQVSGLEAEEWQGKNVFDMVAPEHVERVRRWADECVLGNQNTPVLQLEFLTISGDKIPVEASLNVVESDGEVIGVQAIARDLRQRLEAEHQIRELQALNEHIIRNAPIGIATTDRNGVFTSVNPAFAEILGFASPDFLLGQNTLEYPAINKFNIREVIQRVLDGKAEEQIFSFRTILTEKDVNAKAFGVPMLNERDEVQGALFIMADLSREKELEKQLVQSEKLSSIGGLVSGVAHELNNPLTAIMGYSQLLSINADLSPKSLDMAHKIQRSAERCKKIVENLLSFARRKTPEKCIVDVNQLLDQTLDLRSYDFQVNNVEIKRSYDTKMRLTAGDPDQLQQVFLNLINNAFDAMYDAHARGTLEIRTYEASDNHINIEFIDNGPGVPDSIRHRIFDPFVTTKPVGKGTGLGLSLSYGIVQAHGGSIMLDNQYHAGAKFLVKLPIESIERLSVDAPPQPENAAGGDSRRILLVDDEEQILECTKLLLEKNHFRVTTACNGEEARRILDTRSFDVIVSDLRMPGSIDGRTLYDLLCKDKTEQASRMIFMTGDTLDSETARFLKRIPNKHVKKPFTGRELMDSINAVMSA
ncbi:PAS domain S-box protein [Candidatus Poribacteria bacterium]|nr:PAS domain S-box protein [Candidatus Poribacteria bacterium]